MHTQKHEKLNQRKKTYRFHYWGKSFPLPKVKHIKTIGHSYRSLCKKIQEKPKYYEYESAFDYYNYVYKCLRKIEVILEQDSK